MIIVVTLTVSAPVVFSADIAQPLEPYHPAPNLTHTLRLAGNRNMDRLVRAWAEAYHGAHPEIDFQVEMLGNGTGMPRLYLGQADIAFFGRDTIVTDNDAFAHVLKYPHLRIDLGTGSLDAPGKSPALVLFVHRDNPLNHLTLAQVDAIFSALRRRGASAAIRTWGDLGLTGEWAGQPIHLYADNTQSMTGVFFQHAALKDSRMMNWEHYTEFDDVRHADGTVTEAAEQSRAALRRDRYGLALSNLHYLDDGVKALALAERAEGPFVSPTRETLVSREYPLTRTIFACVNQPPGRALDPKVRDFLRFILTEEGQRVLANDGQYLPLAPDAAKRERAKLP